MDKAVFARNAAAVILFHFVAGQVRALCTRDHSVPVLARVLLVQAISRPHVTGNREGLDPNVRLNHLSTFLGHMGLHSTSVYLTITSEILQSANQRLEAFGSPTSREVRR